MIGYTGTVFDKSLGSGLCRQTLQSSGGTELSLHIKTEKKEVAEKVLLPGDPLRAKYIAENFLEKPVCYNQVRGMLGYTGIYRGKRVSVQGTGMGMPSLGIYATELMQEFGIKRAIRVGTCGAIQEGIDLKDLILATGASTDSNMNRDRFGSISFAPVADFTLLADAAAWAADHKLPYHVGGVYTSDKFYDDRNPEKLKLMHDHGVLAVDMETCELYTLAAKYGVSSLTVMTVSDSFVTKQACSAEERQTAFNAMMELALEVI